MSFNKILSCLFCLIFTVSFSNLALAQNVHEAVAALAQDWASAKYQATKNNQLVAFEELIERAEQLSKIYPNDPELLTWYGTILCSYSSIKGGISVLPHVKKARNLLEQALTINTQTADGMALCVLGSLYARVPGKPIAFGNKTKAQYFLEQALKVAPNSIHANYYYGDFLMAQGKHKNAHYYLSKALHLPVRSRYVIEDTGRKNEAEQALTKLQRSAA